MRRSRAVLIKKLCKKLLVVLQTIEKVQNRALKLIFHIKGKISFTKLRKDTNIPSLADSRKQQGIKLYYNSSSTGVIKPSYYAPKKCHDTRQSANLFNPAIETNAFCHSFWPQTIRDLRGEQNK